MPLTQRDPNPVLRRLDSLVGEWRIEASIDGELMAAARLACDWAEGGSFLVQRTEGEPAAGASPAWQANAPFPVSTITGLDDQAETFTQLYADQRGVLRVYRMTLADGVMTVWREAPEFHQRYTGTFSEDGSTLTGAWEASEDGTQWRHDFDLIHTRVA